MATSLTTSADAPYLDAVYKLQEYVGRPRRKRSAGKATWPGRKQVWRTLDARHRFARDVITVAGEARARCLGELGRLPAPQVQIAPALRRLAGEVDRAT